MSVALDGKKALEIVAKKSIDLILLDILMPDMDGYELCAILKSQPRTEDIPVMFITVKRDDDDIEKTYEIGGVDCITKPFRPKELLAKIKRELKLQELHEELRELALRDSMTKLYNRRYFSSVSEDIYNIALREKTDLSLIMIDIDRFKNINDTYGHKIGDDVIIDLAIRLIVQQRKSDIICRFGGEEFVILLQKTSLEGAGVVAEKIRSELESSVVRLKNGKSINYTVSLGVAQVNFQKKQSIEDVLNQADNALYRAKDSGRNRICFSR